MPSAHTVTPSPPLPPRWIHWPRWVRRHHRGARWQWNAWQVFLLPTPFGWLYGGALGALFLFAANYQLSLAYLLLFVISAFGVTAAVQTVRVAHGVTFTAQPPEWVFAGDPVTWTLHWHAPLDAQGSALTVSAVTPDGHVVARRVLFDGAAGAVTLALPTHRRGAYPAPCFALSTTLPWGLFRAWAVWHPPLTAWAVPRPLPDAPPLPRTFTPRATALALGREQPGEGVDWGDWRAAQRGEPLRRVHMRQLARRGNLWLAETTAPTAPSDDTVWLRFEAAAGANLEEKLACLVAWVLHADALGLRYGLALPGFSLAPQRGAAHKTAALLQLAKYEERQ
ncbi:MAG: hypothetical protein ACK4JZ_04675 [Hydrogenophilus thermoluteolus]